MYDNNDWLMANVRIYGNIGTLVVKGLFVDEFLASTQTCQDTCVLVPNFEFNTKKNMYWYFSSKGVNIEILWISLVPSYLGLFWTT